MSDDYSRVLTIIGLAFNLVGVLILFRWGMPFRVASGGHILLAIDRTDAQGIALDRIYTLCGWAGLTLLVLGTVLQIVAALMPPTKLG
jgi:hypothetical protein